MCLSVALTFRILCQHLYVAYANPGFVETILVQLRPISLYHNIAPTRSENISHTSPRGYVSHPRQCMHALRSTPIIKCFDTMFSSIARMLDTSKWSAQHVAVVIIDPDHASINGTHSPISFDLVFSVDYGSQAIF